MTDNRKARNFIVIAVVLTAAAALIAPLQASSLRDGQTGAGATVTGSLPGEVFWTYYDTIQSATACSSTTSGICDAGGNGDNILRLINPNGNANRAFDVVEDVCAMIYVFDDTQEMGECCGCPLSPAGFESFSVEHDLTSNWIFGNNPDGNTVGAIAIAVTSGNVDFIPTGQSPSNGHNCAVSQSAACNGGCDPTTQPGYSVSAANNLLGGITHNQTIGTDGSSTSGLTEVPLFDDAGGDPDNLIYLQNECASLVGGGSGAGFCSCPEIPPPPTSPSPPTVAPTPAAQYGNYNNTVNGGPIITVLSGGADATLNSLVIVAIDVFADVNGVFPTVTPPATSGGHPAWNLITSTSVGSSPVNMVQYLYWHAIGSGETGFGGPSFDFLLTGDGSPEVNEGEAPSGCVSPNTPGCFRATSVGSNYTGTCTEDSTPCANPISGVTTGTANNSNSVVSAATVAVPTRGIALVMYGTDNTSVYIGSLLVFPPPPSGTSSDGCPLSGGPPLCSTNLIHENGNEGTNAGLTLFDQVVITGGAIGPFTGTLPNDDTGNNIVQGIGIIPIGASVTPTPASSATPTATATQTPTSTAAPTNTATPTVTPTPCACAPQSGNSNNTVNGNVGIGISAGGGSAMLNSLVIVAIDVLPDVNGVLPTVTPPATSGGHPAWNLITSTSVGSSPVNIVQYLYWHAIGSGETGFGGPSFDFMLTGDGSPANCDSPGIAGCFRASSVGTNSYDATCLEDAVPCANPISGVTTGTSNNSNSVVSAGTVSVPTNGIVVGLYGTDNTNVYIGQSGTPAGTVSDGCPLAGGPPVCSTNLIQENANGSINAGVALFDQLALTGGGVGPLTGTLPDNDTGNNIIQGIGIIPK